MRGLQPREQHARLAASAFPKFSTTCCTALCQTVLSILAILQTPWTSRPVGQDLPAAAAYRGRMRHRCRDEGHANTGLRTQRGGSTARMFAPCNSCTQQQSACSTNLCGHLRPLENAKYRHSAAMQLQHGASLASCCLQTRQRHAPCRPPGLHHRRHCRRQQPSSSSSVAPYSSKQLAATTGATAPSPSSQQPQTSAAAAPDAPGPSTPLAVPGFCGLPLVDSPGAFRAYYYRRTRPRLDALYRACSSYRQGEVQLLDALDALLCELKSMQAKARHCAQCHASR